MRPVQFTIDDDLLREIDALPEVREHGRSAVLRRALRDYLQRRRNREIDAAYERGYAASPVREGEFYVDPESLSWPEE